MLIALRHAVPRRVLLPTEEPDVFAQGEFRPFIVCQLIIFQFHFTFLSFRYIATRNVPLSIIKSERRPNQQHKDCPSPVPANRPSLHMTLPPLIILPLTIHLSIPSRPFSDTSRLRYVPLQTSEMTCVFHEHMYVPVCASKRRGWLGPAEVQTATRWSTVARTCQGHAEPALSSQRPIRLSSIHQMDRNAVRLTTPVPRQHQRSRPGIHLDTSFLSRSRRYFISVPAAASLEATCSRPCCPSLCHISASRVVHQAHC